MKQGKIYVLLLAATLIAGYAENVEETSTYKTVNMTEKQEEQTQQEIAVFHVSAITTASYNTQEHIGESDTPAPGCTDKELEMLAKMVWGEARGCDPEEQALVIWTAFQQVDAGGDFADYKTLSSVLTKKYNFAGYRESNPVDPEIYMLAQREADKWKRGDEPPTLYPYAPTAPYLFFSGDGSHNWFREEW
jgi:hypothetical protein